jgi:metacaspase-1
MNAYPSAPLRGCINDIVAAQAALVAKGFSCVVLTDGMATDARMKAELDSLINGYRAGDIIAIVGSSHGSYMSDASGDEADHRDELICPINFPAGYLSDDWIRGCLGRLPATAKCYVVMDSCYSGTVTRLAQTHKIPVLGNRFMPGIKGKAPKKSKDKAVIVPTMKEVLFAASGENQTSAEILVGGVPRGAFSYYFWKAIGSFPTYTNDQIVTYCKTKIAAIGLGQTPQLECQAAKASQMPFT